MQKNKPYKYFFLLLAQMLFLFGCGQDKNNSQHLVSLIIADDSVSIYTGNPGKDTPSQKIALDETGLKEVLRKQKEKTGEATTLLIRISSEHNQTGTMGRVVNIIKWAEESGITNIEIADGDDIDKRIRVDTAFRRRLDSFAAGSRLQLNMPKEEEVTDPVIDNYTISVILLTDDKWYCYIDTSISKGRPYNRKDFATLLTEKKRQWGKDLFVLIKPTEKSAYQASIDILDQMTIHKIKRYAMYKISDKEEKYFNIHNADLFGSPQPVKVTTPNTVTVQELPQDDAFIIEIREDNSVWYQPISPLIRTTPQKADPPITKNLKKIIADYQSANNGRKISYLIKGNSRSTYPVFEQVINALKENNIYKYHLVTAEN